MNRQVDIIVVGDSKCGNEVIKILAGYKPSLQIAFVSREFKSTTTHDFLNVEYIKEEVIFTDYKNRLFGCYLKNGDRLYCTHLVIATGLKYKPFMVGSKKVPNVFNNVEELPKHSKDLPAVVLGQNNADAKFALAVAKKFKHVYLCTESLEIKDITPANLKKINEAKNLIVLPNTYILKVSLTDNTLKSIELNNYSVLTCSAIFVKTESAPETSFISNKLIGKTETGHLETDAKGESVLVPKCFAIGNCCKKYTKKLQQKMLEAIKADF